MVETQALEVLLTKYAKPGIAPERIARDAANMIRHANAIARCNLKDCNEDMSDDQRSLNDKRAESRLASIVAILRDTYDVRKVVRNGDPRGFPVRIYWPGEECNTWGGKEHGYGIGEE